MGRHTLYCLKWVVWRIPYDHKPPPTLSTSRLSRRTAANPPAAAWSSPPAQRTRIRQVISTISAGCAVKVVAHEAKGCPQAGTGKPVKAAYVERLGAADEIRYGDLPMPEPSPGQAFVRVEGSRSIQLTPTFVQGGTQPRCPRSRSSSAATSSEPSSV